MKGITFTIVTHKAQSLNYGETIGNVSTLKKLTMGSEHKKLITYVSDKALKYDIKRIGKKNGWTLMDQTVVNIIKNCVENIQNSKGDFNFDSFYRKMVKTFEEFDLFGGMFADIGGVYSDKKNKKMDINDQQVKVEIDTTKLQRTAPVRITNAYSISEFVYDSNLLNDIDAYNRYIKYTAGEKKQTLAYSDEHTSYYTYTVVIDLDKISAIEKTDGTIQYESVFDENNQEERDKKKNRIKSLLEIIFLNLNREIRGRIENLTPIFVIGGIYDKKHPFFHNAIRFFDTGNGLLVKGEDIDKVIDIHSLTKADTFIFHCNEVIFDKNYSDNKLTTKDKLNDIITDIMSKF